MGSIERVDVDVLNHIAADYIPVVASVGADREGQLLQRQRGRGCRSGRGRARAYKLVFMTDVEGWLADPNDSSSLVSEADVPTVRRALADGKVGGGMLPKLKACADAVEGGVGFAHIVDGRKPHSLLLELFTDAGIGTKVSPTDE